LLKEKDKIPEMAGFDKIIGSLLKDSLTGILSSENGYSNRAISTDEKLVGSIIFLHFAGHCEEERRSKLHKMR